MKDALIKKLIKKEKSKSKKFMNEMKKMMRKIQYGVNKNSI